MFMHWEICHANSAWAIYCPHRVYCPRVYSVTTPVAEGGKVSDGNVASYKKKKVNKQQCPDVMSERINLHS